MERRLFAIRYYIKKTTFIFLFSLIFIYINLKLFYPILTAKEVIISYGIHPFDICSQNSELWKLLKILYLICMLFSNFIFCHLIYSRILKKFSFFSTRSKQKLSSVSSYVPVSNNDLSLLVGLDSNNNKVYIPEKGLYQNFLITGTIGSGKTSSAMYPFTKQLIEFNFNNPKNKIGMLILDVKGNFYNQVKKYAKKYNLEKDLIVIELKSNVYYNPLHKPKLKPQVLANRLKNILLLFSENNSESYWLDKAEEVLTECIKLCRLYNNNYVTFTEIHKLVTIPDYYKEKINILRELFISSKLTTAQIYELNSSLNFFQKEFDNLDSRTKGILISEITRITNCFISDFDVMSTFCAPKEQLSFTGFYEVIKKGKIVVLNMNIAEYESLSRIIAAYLKQDFQSEILSNLSKTLSKTTAFICDEYDKYVTKSDAEFFSLSREAKCINIVSTQSYSSLKSTLKDDTQVKVIIQNLINKIWFRTDDIFTIEEAQKQLGKEEKERISRSISESAKQTRFSYITNTLNSQDSNISETFSTSIQNDFIYETNFFTQELETFNALTFLSDGSKIYSPQKLKMLDRKSVV